MSSLSPGGAVDGPGEEVYQNKNVLYITTHRTPGSHNSSGAVRVLVRSCVMLSPWGGLGEPGEACVKCGEDLTTLGAHAPTRGASPKKQQTKQAVWFHRWYIALHICLRSLIHYNNSS